MIQFNTTSAERKLIDKIVDRIQRVWPTYDRIDAAMDLVATHSNGTPLDFEKLLAADDFTFGHDIYGIHHHIDRETGKLSNHFLPRCSKPKKTFSKSPQH